MLAEACARLSNDSRGIPERIADGDLSEWARATREGGLGLLRGMPVGEPPPTPHSFGVETGTGALTDLLVEVGKTFGAPCTFEDKVNSNLVHDVYYVPRDHDTQLGSGASKLEWHVEDGCFENRANWLFLLCIRGAGSVATSTAHIDDLHLPVGDVALLMNRRVRLKLDDSFVGAAQTIAAVPTLDWRGGRFEIVFDPAYSAVNDADLLAALDRLSSEACRVRTDIVLGAGDLLVIDNRRVMHARSAYDLSTSARDRWLKRMLVMSEVEAVDWTEPGVVRGRVFQDAN